MAESRSPLAFLRARSAQILTAVLLLEVGVFYGMSRTERIPPTRPLREVPAQFGEWQLRQETPIEKEVLDVLRADDTLSRFYVRPSDPVAANLFVAFFRSQRAGQVPHSPKNCLPGSGWIPTSEQIITINVPGLDHPIEANRYIVAKGDQKSAVLYWYQSRDRVVASEYKAKIYTVADALRYNRTDTALVRVVVPVVDNNENAALERANEFVRAFYQPLRQYFPA